MTQVNTHGGKRERAGRKPSPRFGKATVRQVTLYDWHITRLRQIDPDNLSRAIRCLIENSSDAHPRMRRADKKINRTKH